MYKTLILRTLLFVPGTQLELIPKAFATKADGVIVDWEDAVEADKKAQIGRAHV